MENYFVVLQLPTSKEHKYSEGKTSPEDFRKNTANAIKSGGVKLISLRTDTGSAEEIRKHAAADRNYRTFVILTLALQKFPGRESLLRRSANRIMSLASPTTVIESAEKFQVLAM
ncbi:MAG: hypothetical protein ACO1N9_04270 [Flavobacterium sp.]